MFAKLRQLTAEQRRDLRIALLLMLAAAVCYAPGITWGMPDASEGERTRAWGIDEIAPMGPLFETRNLVTHGPLGNPQYPIFHYLFLCASYAPYLTWEMLTGGLVNPRPGHPYGFTDVAASIQMLLLIARSVSVLMAGGILVAVYFAAKELWDRATGMLAALGTLSLYPMFYYGKTSNVDVPAMFWSCIGLALFAGVLREGLSARRAVGLGLCAGLAVGTKDASYATFLLLPVPILVAHFRELNAQGRISFGDRWTAPAIGLAVSTVAYGLASGLFIYPRKFWWHLQFVRAGNPAGGFYFEYEPTVTGYGALLRECLTHLTTFLGLPLLAVALAGVAWCALRERRALWLLLPVPALFLFVLVPVRFVQLRFVFIWAVVLSFFAARAMAVAWRSQTPALRWGAAGLMLAAGAYNLARGAELSATMNRDSRVAAMNWVNAQLQPGQRLEIFGPAMRMRLWPRLREDVLLVPSNAKPQPGNGKIIGDLVLLYGDDLGGFKMCPRWVFEGLHNGSLGYDLAGEFQTSSRYGHHDQFPVNPRILIFKRRDAPAASPAPESSKLSP
jgi:hypothetical protein